MRAQALFLAIGLLLNSGELVGAPQAGGSVKGSMVDESGSAIPGVSVQLFGPGVNRFRTTGREGRFSFADVPAGTYTLTASVAGFGSETRPEVSVSGSELDLPPITLTIASLSEIHTVTGDPHERLLVDVPVTQTIVRNLINKPTTTVAGLLQEVPGLNFIQMSPRDFNLTSRQSTATLSSSQLALIDGRSIYLDFFGMILWDMVPSNPADIKQIEVVRGPASAVHGANALTGVVNFIMKTPREAPGGTLTLGAGGFGRNGEDAGRQYNTGLSWAAAPNDRWSYRVSAGYYHSDAFSRPSGRIAADTHPLDSRIRTGGGLLPDYVSQGTSQPKVDLRVDQELVGGGRLTYSGGLAATDGIVHSGLGPFDLQNGSYLGYGRVAYRKNGFKAAGFVNSLHGEAPNLLARDAEGNLIELNFDTRTYDFEVGNTHLLAGGHALSYGGNVRRNDFDITIAPSGRNRTEMGGYVQGDIALGRFRMALGGRLDKFGNIADPVFSPRVSVMFKPASLHSLRVSYNRAFRSPSLINNHLDLTINQPADLSPFAAIPGLPPSVADFFRRPFPLPVRAIGSEVAAPGFSDRDLKPESLTAYEIAYTGTFGRTTLGIAAYINDQHDNINFVSTPGTGPLNVPFYTPASPPPGFPDHIVGPPIAPVPMPLGSFVVAALAQRGILLPRNVTYLNIGRIRNKGVELSVDHAFDAAWSGFANYSWQADPVPLDDEGDPKRYPTEEIGVPARHRVNAGIAFNGDRLLGNASVNWTDEAFWVDVMDRSTHGRTDAFTMLNGTFGVKWAGGRVTTSLKGVNLLDQRIQQHVFGDIIGRQLMGEVRITF